MDARVIYPKYLRPGSYEFRLNRDKATELTPWGSGIGGLDLLKPFLNKPIADHLLLKEPDDWPSSLMIRKGNEDRDIRIEMIKE